MHITICKMNAFDFVVSPVVPMENVADKIDIITSENFPDVGPFLKRRLGEVASSSYQTDPERD